MNSAIGTESTAHTTVTAAATPTVLSTVRR